MCEAPQPDAPDLAPGLYIVATPIGNLADLSPRARRLIETANIIAAEDTRTARKLLRGGETRARFVSLTEHNVEERTSMLLEGASEGAVALVSEAGTPGIADPGARLVKAAHMADVRVFSVPGPSALASALAASGFETPWSLFLGFLPRKRGERTAALQRAAEFARVVVFFESPGRLSGALADVAEALGDVEAVVCREVSKLHEEIAYGTAGELAQRFKETRGECTVVLQIPERDQQQEDEGEARALLAAMKRAGARRSAAAAEVAKLSTPNRDRLYRLWEEL